MHHSYKKVKQLSWVKHVDPDILGGLTLQVGDRFMDLSISNKINKMHNLLSESV